jgi:ferredoxin
MGSDLMRLTVRADRCTGHGRCYSLAPELLDFDDEGFVTLRGRVIDVPDIQLTAASDAVAGCPEQAIELLADLLGGAP